ncbi:RecA-superfamily ATPases implicated in signal transduction [Archaeoglobus sulfaticallidus PM70-1]|uniref:non-specific serine/threonine protein kinase n=1 Tax=Archaeoglobus sulfaticallidus PM70-1 TaxID=387631 RepID=N0BMB0_9EURY|nr:ATPase domain-containing protein [Archaeoglobus sulfaticallidus]AGK61761.1 RecA-superfamily ATPases implicated in signal transduction [Archaeoglobus sulfaticallidus PM70-1]
MSFGYFKNKIIEGDFPEGSIIMIAGEPGTGKTILVSSIAHEEIKEGKKVLFVSFNETKQDFFKYTKKLGFELENENFRYMDLFTAGRDVVDTQLSFIFSEIEKFNPNIIVIDSITAILSVLAKENIRTFLHTSLGRFVKKKGATAFIIAEKPIGSEEFGYGVEEFVVDGLIILRYLKHDEHYRRILEVPKMRGLKIKKPQYEYTITDKGIFFFDIPELNRIGEASFERVSTGIKELDELVGGGFYRGSITVFIGNTGTGKTTFGLHFTYNNALNGKKALFITFEESEENILRAMRNYGMDYSAVKENMIIKDMIPEAYSPVTFFARIYDLIESFKPEVLFIDSFSSLNEHMEEVELSKMVRYIQLTVKRLGITLCTTLNLEGNLRKIPQTGLSTLSDNIVLLWYELENDSVHRKLLILKSRSTDHSRKIHSYEITDDGIRIIG